MLIVIALVTDQLPRDPTMDENGLKSADRGENVENKVAHFTASEPPSEGQASDSKLQVVWCDSKLRELWSPKLDLSEEVADGVEQECP